MAVSDDARSTSSQASTIKADRPARLEAAEKPAAIESERELTIRSALQVLGGFMLLFNSYSSF